jgi:hypothetical protein
VHVTIAAVDTVCSLSTEEGQMYLSTSSYSYFFCGMYMQLVLELLRIRQDVLPHFERTVECSYDFAHTSLCMVLCLCRWHVLEPAILMYVVSM